MSKKTSAPPNAYSTNNLKAKVYLGEPYGSALFSPVYPDTSMRFKCWKDDYGNEIYEDTVVSIDSDHTLTAEWELPTYYIIRFDGNGSQSGQMDDMICEYDVAYDLPMIEYDKGKEFAGWSTKPDGTGKIFSYDRKVKNLADKQNRIITLYALWNHYNVTYHDAFGEVISGPTKMSHVFVPKGIGVLPELQIKGLVFMGWRNGSGSLIGGAVSFIPKEKYVPTFDLDLYPVYALSNPQYRMLFFDDNGGEGGPGTMLIKDYEDVALPTITPTRPLYVFDGWEFTYSPDPKTFPYTVRINNGESLDKKYLYPGAYLVLHAKWKFVPTKLYFDLGYDGKVVPIELKKPVYELPEAGRNGYDFLGWGTIRDCVRYFAKEEFTIKERGTTLYAVWKPKTFVVEYYDPFNDEVILSDTVTVEGSFRGNLLEIGGLKFEGWTDTNIIKSLDLSKDSLSLCAQIFSQPKYLQGEKLNKLTVSETVRLYPCYSLEQDTSETTTVLYVFGKNGPVYPAGHFSWKDGIQLSNIEPQRGGCKFDKWFLLAKKTGTFPYIYNLGETIQPSGKDDVVFCFPVWKSVVHLYLDLGLGGEPIDKSGKFLPGSTIKASELFTFIDLENDEIYQTGWMLPDGTVVPLDSWLTIPDEDTTLTAVYGEKTYPVYYHNGFSLELECVENLKHKDSVYRVPKNIPEGYKFLGWVSNPSGGALAYMEEPDYTEDNPYADLDGELHLYSCFVEDVKSSKDNIAVIYNPMGGIGGPGLEYYNPKKGDYSISTKKPSKAGCTFAGWSHSPDTQLAYYGEKDEIYDGIIDNNTITLFAVWIKENELKSDLQARFTKQVMPDKYFDTEYISDGWEQAGPYCYFVIKTRNVSKSEYFKEMQSTVMIMECVDGSWNLEALGAGMSFSDAVKFYILTNNSDTVGKLTTGIIDVLECTASILIPGAGAFFAALNYYDLFYDCMTNWSKETFGKTVVDIYVDKILDEINDELKQKGLSDGEVVEIIKSIRHQVVDIVESSYSENYSEAVNDVVLGMLNAVCDKKKRDLEKKIKAAEEISADIEREIMEQSVDVLSRMDSLELIDLRSCLKNWGISLVPIAYTFAFDWISNSDYKSNADPFGDYDVAIEEFRRAVKNQGFGSEIVDGVYGVAQKIFKDYYSIYVKLQ